MLDIKDYIYNQIISEAKFQKGDWMKTNHTYAQDVIDKLIAGEEILLNDGNLFKASKKEIEALKNIHPNYDDDSLEAFNAIFKAQYGRNFNLWNNIFKGIFSGHTGQSDGQIYESLVCYLFNYDEEDINIEGWCEYVGVQPNQSWIESSKTIVQYLNEVGFRGTPLNNHDYVACHVDDKDYMKVPGCDFAYELTSIFGGKTPAKNTLKVNVSDLYNGNNKDVWNKADIVLVRKDQKNIISDMRKVITDGFSLNAYLSEKLEELTVIPISLKKVTNIKKIHLTEINTSKSGEIDTSIKKVDCIRIAKDVKDEERGTGSITIICDEGREIEFRRNTNANSNLSVEAKSSKLSRAGKAISTIKSALGIKDTPYTKLDSMDDFIHRLENYGFVVRTPNTQDYLTCTPPMYERVCCTGLIGILDAYVKIKEPDKNNIPLEFANFCWLSATQGTGSYIKIDE